MHLETRSWTGVCLRALTYGMFAVVAAGTQASENSLDHLPLELTLP